jgi:H+/Cl- antiporter ClcA
MGIDIKLPIGLMFSILGAVLAIYGFITKTNPDIYHKSLDININLWTGAIMLVFGIFMILASVFQRKEDEGKKAE